METKPKETREQRLNKMAFQVFIARCQNFNLGIFGNEQQRSEAKTRAAAFFEAEANASFSIADRFLKAMEKRIAKSNGKEDVA